VTHTLKAVFFDYGGTLDANGVPWFNQFYPLYKEAGLNCTRDEFAPAFYAADDNLPTRFNLTGKSLAETVHLQAGCVAEALAPDNKSLADKVTEAYLDQVRPHLARNRELLLQLKSSFKLGIISNNYGNLTAMLASEGLLELFDTVVDSGVVGATKPAPKIFNAALDALAVAPANALMVGDSIPRDMQGAEAMGMPHAWLRGHNPIDKVCCSSALILDDLVQLPGKLFAQTETA
jgi:HAD superfamily hydrolase (TIGR01549 family)